MFVLCCLALLGLSACSPAAVALPTTAPVVAQPTTAPNATPLPTDTPTSAPTTTVTATVTPSPTVTLTPTPSPTPPPLPVFQSRLLRYAQPQTYLAEPCYYLARRWAADASPPGAVVVPIMFHSIVKDGRPISDPKDIAEADFINFMAYAHKHGFQTITTAQLLDFLLNNAPIPPRAMLLILDDRRPGVIENNFMPLLEQYNWSITPAYITNPDSLPWAWEWMLRLHQSGRLDVQSHGYTGELYIQPDTPAEAIQHEIWDSTAVLAERFGARPLAFIWPGGNFSPLALEIARTGGYQLGFTAFSRGPLFFNWIPQGEVEIAAADPLLLLPRAWSNSIPVNIDQALQISAQQVADARQQYPAEAAYFRSYCGGELPALETILPAESAP